MNKIAVVALTAVSVAIISGIAIAAYSKHTFEDTFLA